MIRFQLLAKLVIQISCGSIQISGTTSPTNLGPGSRNLKAFQNTYYSDSAIGRFLCSHQVAKSQGLLLVVPMQIV